MLSPIIKHGHNAFTHSRDKEIMLACPDCKNIKALLASFQEFGYSTLTREDMETSYEEATTMSRDEAKATGNIVTMMTRTQLVEAGFIKDE